MEIELPACSLAADGASPYTNIAGTTVPANTYFSFPSHPPAPKRTIPVLILHVAPLVVNHNTTLALQVTHK